MDAIVLQREQEHADDPAWATLLILLTSYELLALALEHEFATATLGED